MPTWSLEWNTFEVHDWKITKSKMTIWDSLKGTNFLKTDLSSDSYQIAMYYLDQ